MKICQKVHVLLSVLAFLVAAGARPATAQMLLNGGSTPTDQGWATLTNIGVPAGNITNNGTYTEITTLGTTGGGGGTSGTLLYSKAADLTSKSIFQIDFFMQVVNVTGGHDPLDAAVAFATSFDGQVGTSFQRGQMLSFENNRIQWGDDSAVYMMNTTDAFHLYSLTVDTVSGVATLAVDGVTRLTRNGYVTQDKVVFGDQTNDPNVNGDFRLAYIAVPEPATSTLALAGLGGIGVLMMRRRQVRHG